MCIRDRGYIDSYLEKYSGVRRYMEEIKEKARQDGYVTTLWAVSYTHLDVYKRQSVLGANLQTLVYLDRAGLLDK